VNNHFYNKAHKKASGLKDKQERIRTLLKSFAEKLIRVSLKNERVRQLKDQFQVLSRIVKAYIEGDYQTVPWTAMVSVLAAIIYFINPFDLIPDMIPIIGLTDDVSVLLWVFKSLGKEIDAFVEWEKSHKTT
jgi:uncharacterized membrane protein YkvA (DUF1232 family)